MTSTTDDCPNPSCPRCSANSVFMIKHDLKAPPDFISTQGWMVMQGICDVRPDRWSCVKCEFRWYPRKEIERDLDLLTWEVSRVEDSAVRERMLERLSDLRTMITVVAS